MYPAQDDYHENIKQLEKWGFCIIQANYRSDKYMIDITRLINENIDKCSGLFQDWVNWDYIRSLFFVPKYSKPEVMKQEWLNGADIRPDLTGQAKGSVIMVLDENGIFLGCGRVSVDRIRNFNK